MASAFLLDLQTDPNPFIDLNVIEIMVESLAKIDDAELATTLARNASSLNRPEMLPSIDCSAGLRVGSDVDLARLKPGSWSAARIAFGAADGHTK
jgi:hypothetical protein